MTQRTRSPSPLLSRSRPRASVHALFLLLGLGTLSGAQAEPLARFLARLEQNPTLAGARNSAEAARLQAEAQRGGLEFGLQGGFGGSQTETTFSNPALPAQSGSSEATQLSLSVGLRPFLYGDTADAVARAELQARQARAGERSARTNLQIQAVLGAEQLRLAEAGLASSQEGAALAQTLLEVSRTQLERGVIGPAELREAQSRLNEALERVRSAGESLDLARAAQRQLLGAEATLDPLPTLPLPTGKTPEQNSAEIALEQANLLYGQAQRAVLPTLSASYSLNPGANTSIGLSLDSRTFQPRATLSYQDPSATQRSVTLPGGGQASTAVTQSFQLGVQWGWSPSASTALSSAELNLRGAQLSLDGAAQNAVLTRQRLTVALEQAERQVTLKQASLESAQKKLAEALERQKLGIVGPLIPLQVSAEVSGAQIALSSARLDALQKRLEFYRTYAVPLVGDS